jgi:transposase
VSVAILLWLREEAGTSDLFWLTNEQVERLRPLFTKSHGKPRVGDRRVLSGIVFANRNGLRWRNAPSAYGPHKPASSVVERTLYNRWKRWGETGVFTRMIEGLAAVGAEPKIGHDRRDVSKSAPRGFDFAGLKGDVGCLIGRIKGGMNTKALLSLLEGSTPLPMRTAAP